MNIVILYLKTNMNIFHILVEKCRVVITICEAKIVCFHYCQNFCGLNERIEKQEKQEKKKVEGYTDQ